MQMNENYFQIKNACSFMRHSSLMPDRKTLLFLHGIGDSSLSYLPFFQTKALTEFNILIPDLLGHGKSSKNDDYSFTLQTETIIKQIMALENQMGFPFNDLILIPHSMASIHAMLICESEMRRQIKGIINVEGSITQYGSFVSEAVFKAVMHKSFDLWFQEFKDVTVFCELIKKFPVCRTYYASLLFCHPAAFLQNALEIYKICVSGTGKYTNVAGKKYTELDLPKIYCYGDKNKCQESLNFLHEMNLKTKSFGTANHFIMMQCFDEFTQFIIDWIGSFL